MNQSIGQHAATPPATPTGRGQFHRTLEFESPIVRHLSHRGGSLALRIVFPLLGLMEWFMRLFDFGSLVSSPGINSNHRDCLGNSIKDWYDFGVVGFDAGTKSYFFSLSADDVAEVSVGHIPRLETPSELVVQLQQLFPNCRLKGSVRGVLALTLVGGISPDDLLRQLNMHTVLDAYEKHAVLQLLSALEMGDLANAPTVHAFARSQAAGRELFLEEMRAVYYASLQVLNEKGVELSAASAIMRRAWDGVSGWES